MTCNPEGDVVSAWPDATDDTEVRIKHWRARAEELRALSGRFTVPTVRAILLELALRFEEVAKHLEQRDIRSQ